MRIGSVGRALLNLLPVFCASAALTIGLQWLGNSYGSEWSSDPDEPAHYVTGLMVHDYVRSGLPASPIAYAQGYAEHYPKVAIGHWPPMFYVLQAAWTLLFGVSRASLLLLMAALSAVLLSGAYALVRTYFPAWMAWLSLILLAASPDFLAGSRSVMAEIPTALFILAALWALAYYFKQPGLRTATWFSLVSLAAVLTKGTAIALAPLPLLDAGLMRRWRILRTLSFWLPAILGGVPALLWFLAAPDALQQSVVRFGGLGVRWMRIPETLRHWLLDLGFAGALLAAIGFLRKARATVAGTEKSPIWISALAFLPVTVACRILIGPWEPRHLLTTLPLLMLFLCDGLACVQTWFQATGRRERNLAAPIVTAIALAALGFSAIHNVMAMPPKVHLGIDRAASDLIASPEYRDDRFLIVSDAVGEGVFIAEVAAREPRPGHVIERGSKILSDESFMGDRYRPRFATPSEMMQFFDQGPDRILILDGVPPSPQHVAQVRSMVREYPNRWHLLGQYPRTGTPFPLEIYQLLREP